MRVIVQLAMLSFLFLCLLLLSYLVTCMFLYFTYVPVPLFLLAIQGQFLPLYFLDNIQYMCSTFAFVIGIDPVWGGVLTFDYMYFNMSLFAKFTLSGN